jgi:hypothetical protein
MLFFSNPPQCYEGALTSIELANGVAYLSTYPSVKALELFAEAFK